MDVKRLRFFHALRSRLGLPPVLIRRELLGRTVTARFGTIHDRPDYDYGWAYALIHRCAVLFDVGCNVGLESLMACVDRPGRPVLAIDANPHALAMAAENLFLNGFAHQVRFALGFVGAVDGGEVDFYALGTGSAASDRPRRGATALRVPRTTLDRLAEEVGLAPDLIKIDVEGAEAEVLVGAVELTRRHRPRFLVEMHSPPNGRWRPTESSCSPGAAIRTTTPITWPATSSSRTPARSPRGAAATSCSSRAGRPIPRGWRRSRRGMASRRRAGSWGARPRVGKGRAHGE
jgi:FkbM family methyltransferase